VDRDYVATFAALGRAAGASHFGDAVHKGTPYPGEHDTAILEIVE
jgi:hypothetical protein